jgi:hypothetical protein
MKLNAHSQNPISNSFFVFDKELIHRLNQTGEKKDFIICLSTKKYFFTSTQLLFLSFKVLKHFDKNTYPFEIPFPSDSKFSLNMLHEVLNFLIHFFIMKFNFKLMKQMLSIFNIFLKFLIIFHLKNQFKDFFHQKNLKFLYFLLYNLDIYQNQN